MIDRSLQKASRLNRQTLYARLFPFVPSKEQIKYLSNYLTQRERRIVRIATTFIALSLIVLGVQFTRDFVVATPKPGGTYVEALVGSPRFVNPILSQTNDTDRDLTALLFSGLVRPGKDGKMEPDIAESFEISEDQKTYTFHLRRDVTFHHGAQLTANDVQFTFQNILDPAFRSPLRSHFQGVGLQKVDDFTVQFILNEPFTPFLESLKFGILPEDIWSEIPAENALLTDYNLKPFGTGPYAFDTFKKSKAGAILSYTLKRNEAYYGQKPYIETLEFKFYDSLAGATEAVSEKQVDGIRFVPRTDRADLKKKNDDTRFTSLRLPQYTAIFFNQTNSLVKLPEVRQALALGIDKERIIREVFDNEGEVIHGPILPGFVGYNPDIRKYDFNLEEAKKILEDKGWKFPAEPPAAVPEQPAPESPPPAETEENTTNTNESAENSLEAEEPAPAEESFPVRMKDGKELALAISTIDQPEYLKTIDIIRESWKELGVRLDVKTYTNEDILRLVIKPRDYEAILFGEIVGFDPDPYPFWHSSQSKDPGLNLAVFYNKDVDQLLEEARQTNDDEQRRLKYLHFGNILADELPAIFLYNPTYTYALHKKVKGIDEDLYISEPSDRFRTISNWYIKTNYRLKFN